MCRPKKNFLPGCWFVSARLHIARPLAMPSRELSVQSTLTRALWDTAADRARTLCVFFFLAEEGGRRKCPRPWVVALALFRAHDGGDDYTRTANEAK